MRKGFTLIELLVVIAVLGVLAAGVFTAINPFKRVAQARDAQRKTALGQIVQAIETYSVSHQGKYPNTGGNWYSLCTVWGPSRGVNGWIPDLVASGELKNLPLDPVRGSGTGDLTNSAVGNTGPSSFCYIYRSDADGTDYKVAAHCAAEAGPANAGDPFYVGHSNWGCGLYSFAHYSPGAVGW